MREIHSRLIGTKRINSSYIKLSTESPLLKICTLKRGTAEFFIIVPGVVNIVLFCGIVSIWDTPV